MNTGIWRERAREAESGLVGLGKQSGDEVGYGFFVHHFVHEDQPL
jgi:hypothetical protein